MSQLYANIIIDISHESVDRTFQYRVPERLTGQIEAGVQVYIPFGAGNRQRKGYVVELTDRAEYDRDKLKEISGVVKESVTAQSQLIRLAWWMKERYGSTMNQALKTVLPVKQKVKEAPKRRIRLLLDEKELEAAIGEAEKRKYSARLRLLYALKECRVIPYEEATGRLNLTAAAFKPLEEKGVIAVEVTEKYRNPLLDMKRLAEGAGFEKDICLNPAQRSIADAILGEYDRGIRRTYLLHGITGSGKTEVYMELISHVLQSGSQVIVLIPEISLTFQTVMRFYSRFGDRVSVLNSRMSAGERYDQYERARTGDIDIIIGPRSALFAPFSRLGLIIIDEEHENSYKSELSPRYDARETAAWRAGLCGASLLLGSATPSLESYTKALKGEYGLFTLRERARSDARLPKVEIVDLREELKAGNRTIFSRRLKELMEERLAKREQVMLFINRRGYANFVSCRSCGEAFKCPHCDVTLTLHRDGRMMCHYCGYTIRQPERCPSCGSPYIAPFGTGTQKIEVMTARMFPQARILRMDLDTTSRKGGHQEILSSFARGEADILIGTQMIVKGHDFPRVTLVGALAADLSLYASDYRCSEETFQLLTQAAGRAGRGDLAGNVVIQTYQPDHYSIQSAAVQDYDAFYRQEMAYRRLLGYPPAVGLLTIRLSCSSEEILERAGEALVQWIGEYRGALAADPQMIGPVNAPVYKVNDIYRKILYIKLENYDILIQIRKMAEQRLQDAGHLQGLNVQYDLA
ncbi:MAG: primosomal protein N' [Enterocloster sp.]